MSITYPHEIMQTRFHAVYKNHNFYGNIAIGVTIMKCLT